MNQYSDLETFAGSPQLRRSRRAHLRGVSNSPAEYRRGRSSDKNAVYKPLNPLCDQIRLLRLEPGSLDDDIRGTLSIVSVRAEDQPPAYEPVSYCWGGSKPTSKIVLNGTAFSAPRSAVEALRYLRLYDAPRILWIDAICINQHDKLERAYQVGLMAHIYQGGSRTLVWLGMPDSETEEAVDMFQRCEKMFSALLEHRDDWFESMKAIECPQDYNFNLFRSILRRPYFTRLWVYQELVSSEDCHCFIGRHNFQWDILEFICVLLMVRYRRDISARDFRNGLRGEQYCVLPFWTFMERTAPPEVRKLSDSVRRTRNLACSDPRDKIYGIIGLINTRTSGKLPRPAVTIDYESSVISCIRDAVRAMFTEDGNLLNIVDHINWPILEQNDKPAAWPSWLPRFDKTRSDLDSYPYAVQLDDHSADNGRRLIIHDCKAEKDPSALLVSGFRIGTVARTFALFGSDCTSIETFICMLADQLFPDFGYVFLDTISGGSFPTGLIPDANEYLYFWLALKKSMDVFKEQGILSINQALPNKLETYWRSVSAKCSNRRLFIDSNGDLGLGPVRMEKNDIICILFGAMAGSASS